MDRNGHQQTVMDRRKNTVTDSNGQKMYRNGQKQI